MFKDLCSFVAMLAFVWGVIVLADGIVHGTPKSACQVCETSV